MHNEIDISKNRRDALRQFRQKLRHMGIRNHAHFIRRHNAHTPFSNLASDQHRKYIDNDRSKKDAIATIKDASMSRQHRATIFGMRLPLNKRLAQITAHTSTSQYDSQQRRLIPGHLQRSNQNNAA